MVSPYFALFLFFLAISGFVVISLTLNALLGPKSKVNERMQEPFECGATPIQKENIVRIPVRYYALAIMFILFDLEGIFLYMWAVSSSELTKAMFTTFCLFIFLLIWILAYIWREKILDM